MLATLVSPTQLRAAERAGRLTSAPLHWSVTVDEAAALAIAPPISRDSTTTGQVGAFPYAAKIAAYLAGRPGVATVAIRRGSTKQIFSYTKSEPRNVMASVVKISILATVLRQAQLQGRPLTSWEKSRITPMIAVSDNVAANDLWVHVGRGPAVAKTWAALGMTTTTLDPGGAWGLSLTTAQDQVRLMDAFGYRNTVLNDTSRAYALAQLRGVVSWQAWGVSAGQPGKIALKNGWLPYSGWRVNSVGFATAYPPGAYSIAVLTRGSTSMATQVATIEGVSRIIAAEERKGLRGDATGDGIPDLYGITPTGGLVFYRATGPGRFAPGVTVGTGWGAFNWVESAGDLTGDGISDVLARHRTGLLYLYAGNGLGRFAAPRQVGTGWQHLTALTVAGDLQGDGRPDLVGRTAAGELVAYRIDAGAVRGVGKIGAGFGSVTHLVGFGDTNGDQRGEIAGFVGTSLRSWRQSGSWLTGPVVMHNQVNGFAFYGVAGDFTGDRVDDLLTKDAAGRVRILPVLPNGTLATSRILSLTPITPTRYF